MQLSVLPRISAALKPQRSSHAALAQRIVYGGSVLVTTHGAARDACSYVVSVQSPSPTGGSNVVDAAISSNVDMVVSMEAGRRDVSIASSVGYSAASVEAMLLLHDWVMLAVNLTNPVVRLAIDGSGVAAIDRQMARLSFV
jgi:hypothetical protein